MIGATVVPVGAFPLPGYYGTKQPQKSPGPLNCNQREIATWKIRFSPASGVRMTRLAK